MRYVSDLVWSAYGWIVTKANCCMVGCGCVLIPVVALGGIGGGLAIWHFT